MTTTWTWSGVATASGPGPGDSFFGNCIISDNSGLNIVAGFKLYDGNTTYMYPGVVRSIDGGATWNSYPIINTSNLDSTVIGLACTPTMTNVYAIVSGTTTVYRSTDQGATWEEFDIGGTLAQNPTSIAVSNNGVLVFGYAGGVESWSSSDGLNSTAVSFQTKSVAINAAGTVIIAVADDSDEGSGIYKSAYVLGNGDPPAFSRITTSPVSPARTWTSVACTLGGSKFVACHSGSGNDGDGVVYYSSNSGDNWTALTAPAKPYKYVTISPFDDGIAAAAGFEGLYYGLTTDGTPTELTADAANGSTFTVVNVTAVVVKTNSIDAQPTPPDGGVGLGVNLPFVVGSLNTGDGLYQATYTYMTEEGPGGESGPTGPITPLSWTWAPASFPGITGKFVSSIMSDTTGQNIFAGYALDDGSGVYPAVVSSTNGGTGWTGPGVSGSILGPDNYSGYELTKIGLAMSTDMSKMYAFVNGSSRLYISTDQGLGWTGFASYLTYVNPPHQPTALACNGDGTQIAIIASTDPGTADNDAVYYYDTTAPGDWTADLGAGVGATGYSDPPPPFSSIAIGATGDRIVATVISSGGNTGGVYNTSFIEKTLSFTDQAFNNHQLTWSSVSSAFGGNTGEFVVCNYGLSTSGGTGTVFYSENGRTDWTQVYVGYAGTTPAGLFTYATISPHLNGIAVVDAINSLVYYGKTGEAGMIPTFLTCDETTPNLTTQVLLQTSGDGVGANDSLPYVAGRGYISPSFSGVTGPLMLASYEAPPPPVVCFKEGSLILCSVDGKDTYLPVESIVSGTLVKTYKHGDKKVVYIGSSKAYNPGNGKKSLANLAKCTPAKYPELTSDLVLTGAHSILVGDLSEKEREETMELMGKIYITDDKYRLVVCLDDRADAYEHEGVFSIWHFALENEHYTRNYGVYANGLLVETASLRTMKEFSGMNLV